MGPQHASSITPMAIPSVEARSGTWWATALPPERILSAVRDEVAAMDPELVVDNPASMSEVVGRGVSRDRFEHVLMGAFSAFLRGTISSSWLRYGGST